MIVPPGTAEYQESLKKAKSHLIRLHKGSGMLREAIEKQEILTAQKIVGHWEKLANELFVELEIATLIHQQILTGNQVVAKADGTLLKVEEIMKMQPIEMDPWMLLSMEKLKVVFGNDLQDIEISK